MHMSAPTSGLDVVKIALVICAATLVLGLGLMACHRTAMKKRWADITGATCTCMRPRLDVHGLT